MWNVHSPTPANRFAGFRSDPMWQAGIVHRFRRQDSLRRLADEEFDVLVVGGGVTGAGVALDAASRGLKTALVEKRDFASGTSSKSSKMVHGGLRYLQQREFRLVYENLAERQRLLDNAPHLVSPLPFLIPLFGRDGVVSKTLARSYSSALWLYDLTGGLRIGARHKRVSKAEALAHLPTLKRRAPRRRLPLFRRPRRRRPPDPHPGPHGRPRTWRRRGQLHRRRPVYHR